MATTRTEIFESRTFNFTDNGVSSVREFFGQWSDIFDIKNDLLGSTHPNDTDYICNSVDVSEFGDANAGGGPEKAKITAQYSTAQLNTIGGAASDQMTFSTEFGGQMLSIGKGYYWATSDANGFPAVDGTSQHKLFPGATIAYSGILSDLQKDKIIRFIGKINSDSWAGFPSDTLLFDGASATRTVNTGGGGDDRWRVTYKWTYQPDGWNSFFNPNLAPPAFDTFVNSDGTDIVVYERSDFTSLVG